MQGHLVHVIHGHRTTCGERQSQSLCQWQLAVRVCACQDWAEAPLRLEGGSACGSVSGSGQCLGRVTLFMSFNEHRAPGMWRVPVGTAGSCNACASL